VRNRRLYRYCGYRNFASRVRETGVLGYDSAGIATVCEGDSLHPGQTPQSARKLQHIENPSQIGMDILATHGKPEEYNAHPHTDTERRVAVVQNGIIENYRELR